MRRLNAVLKSFMKMFTQSSWSLVKLWTSRFFFTTIYFSIYIHLHVSQRIFVPFSDFCETYYPCIHVRCVKMVHFICEEMSTYSISCWILLCLLITQLMVATSLVNRYCVPFSCLCQMNILNVASTIGWISINHSCQFLAYGVAFGCCKLQ